MPASGDLVTIPANSSVLVDAGALARGETFVSITVPETSELIFADSDVELTVGSLQVNGKLWLGAPTCRLSAKITITFRGTRALDTPAGTKGLFVSNSAFASFWHTGTPHTAHILHAPQRAFRSKLTPGVGYMTAGAVEIHGKQYNPTWTRLAGMAWTGDDRVHLMEAVNWEVGQQVLVTTTTYKDHLNNQNEVRTIAAISPNRTVLLFTEPLAFSHYAKEYQVYDTLSFIYKFERCVVLMDHLPGRGCAAVSSYRAARR